MTRFKLGSSYVTTVLLLTLSASGRAQAVRNTSYVASSDQRVLRHEGVLAPIDTVWRILTTTDGLRSFLAPAVRIGFRPDGRWETAHNAGAQQGDPGNIINEVLTYLPNEMFAVRVVQAASTFVHPEIAKQVWSVYQLQPLGDRRTKLTVSMGLYLTAARDMRSRQRRRVGTVRVLLTLTRRCRPSECLSTASTWVTPASGGSS